MARAAAALGLEVIEAVPASGGAFECIARLPHNMASNAGVFLSADGGRDREDLNNLALLKLKLIVIVIRKDEIS